MRKLIVCDIDNTLLPAGGRISDVTAEALATLDEDTGFTIATGRSFHVVRKFVDDLHLTLPVITSNGAQLYDYANEVSLYETLISPQTIQVLFKKLIEEGFDFVAYADKGIYFRPQSEHLAFFQNYNASVAPELRAPMLPLDEDSLSGVSEKITKVLVYFPTKSLITELQTWEDLEITASMNHVIDIMARNSTKGNAVVALARHLGIPLSSVYCFGDGENDVSMFTCGAVGVAMGNASDSVKKKAQVVTLPCLEDGVAYAIKNLL